MHVRAQQTFKELNDLRILKIHHFADHARGERCRGFNGKGDPTIPDVSSITQWNPRAANWGTLLKLLLLAFLINKLISLGITVKEQMRSHPLTSESYIVRHTKP